MSDTTELRALERFDHVPAGCKLVLARDASNAPHIRPGEFAIVDPSDTTAVPGEPYLIAWQGCGGEAIREVKRRTHRGTDGKPFDGIWSRR